jgi:SAM-dependent methyltransferase
LIHVYNLGVDDSEIQQLEDLESSHFWYRARKLQLAQWFADQKLPLQVLDLASATGGNTLHISPVGHVVSSVEYFRIGVLIQQNKGIPVIQADPRDLPSSDSFFDIVVCLDFLDHIVEDGSVALEIHRGLKSGGIFLISAPEDPKLSSAHNVTVSHVRRYQNKSHRSN